MNSTRRPFRPMILVATLAAFSTGTALADKPEWAGKNKHDKEKAEKHDHGDSRRGSSEQRFDDDSRRLVSDYYGPRFKAGKCPPGLAKKHNGCLPPGQAKKWQKGQALPKDLRVYDLPRELRTRLPPPPPQHRYVRVASDILLIAIGTSMVIDAIEDIGR